MREQPRGYRPADADQDTMGRMILRTLIAGNWFYVLSGILMVIGCHQLVRSIMVTGSELVRTCISLGILQAYEVLVICTAVFIVRRFRILGDAFVLFLVEAALLLDPTFFSNSLGTVADGRGQLVNVFCLALVPVKLLVLQRFLSLRISPGGWAGILLVSSIIYLSPWALMARQPVLTMHGTYYLIGWLLAISLAVFSPLRTIFDVKGGDADFATPQQREWLPRVFVALPLLVGFSHYIESTSVYTIPFFPAFIAPMLAAVAWLLGRNAQRDEANTGRLLLTDILCGVALLLSLKTFNIPDSLSMRRPAHAQPTMMLTYIPLMVCAGAVVAHYVMFYLLSRNAAVLRRLVGLAVLAAVGAAIKLGAVQWTGNTSLKGLGFVVALVRDRPELVLWSIAIVALILAIRHRTFWAWFGAGLMSILLAGYYAPAQPGGVVPEMAQAFVVMGVLLSYTFGGPQEERQRLIALVAVVVTALARYGVQHNGYTAGVVAVQVVGLVVAGLVWRRTPLLVLAALEAIVFVLLLLRARVDGIPVAPLIILAGLGMFAIGLLVTFRKAAWLESLQPKVPPAKHRSVRLDRENTEPEDSPVPEDKPEA